MRHNILIMDTSMLCCWIDVPGKNTCGPTEDQWDHNRVDQFLQNKIQEGATLVLPLATIIETGNHIAQSAHSRYECARKLADIMKKAADNETPWAAFSDQSSLWTKESLKKLAEEWPNQAAQHISIGDATIINVAEHYAKSDSFDVEILTGDEGLKSFEPVRPAPVPRRRKKVSENACQ